MEGYALNVLDRAARTALHVFTGYVVAAQAAGVFDWRYIGLATALAVVVSVLQSLVDFPALPGGWIVDVAARALRSFAQSAVAGVGAAVLLTDVPWQTVLTAAAVAALSSVATSVAATPFGSEPVKGTPALVPFLHGHKAVGVVVAA
jgi:hypothetical protein